MENKNSRELSLEELDRVIGGASQGGTDSQAREKRAEISAAADLLISQGKLDRTTTGPSLDAACEAWEEKGYKTNAIDFLKSYFGIQ